MSLERCLNETGSGRESETGLVRETKWGPRAISFQSSFIRPQAQCLLGLRAKRNETGVFEGVTGKALRQAPPYTVTNRKDPFNFNGLDDATFWAETVFISINR